MITALVLGPATALPGGFSRSFFFSSLGNTASAPTSSCSSSISGPSCAGDSSASITAAATAAAAAAAAAGGRRNSRRWSRERVLQRVRGGSSSTGGRPSTTSTTSTTAEVTPAVTELMRRGGWGAEEAAAALDASGGDAAAAHEALATAEEGQVLAAEGAALAELKEKHGYAEDVAREALRDCHGDVGEALAALQKDAADLARQLEEAVAQMVTNGWDEDAARAKLLERMEERKKGRRSIDGQGDGGAGAAAGAAMGGGGAAESGSGSGSGSGSDATMSAASEATGYTPPPVNMSEVHFNLTREADLQKLVLDSPVPVVLDVHAAWCEPCKALAPILENVARGAGGQLKVCKVDSDAVPSISSALNVQALPSVFVFKRGKIVDSFVGIPTEDALKQFFMRVVMDDVPRPQPPKQDSVTPQVWDNMSPQEQQAASHQHSDAQLAALGSAVARSAGLSAMGFARKEQLDMDVAALMAQLQTEVDAKAAGEGGEGEEGGGAAVSLAAAAGAVRRYLGNAEKDIHNARFRNISTGNAYYQKHVAPFPSAAKLLGLVGFKPPKGGAGSNCLVVRHRNVAPMVSE